MLGGFDAGQCPHGAVTVCFPPQQPLHHLQWRHAAGQLRRPALRQCGAGPETGHTGLHLPHHRLLHSAGPRGARGRYVLGYQPHGPWVGISITFIPLFFFFFPLIQQGFENPRALVVLVEEELVVIDLQTPGWPTIPAPYLAPLHSSAITCSYHISNVPLKLWERIVSAGEQQSPRLSSAVSAGVCG